MYAQQQSSSVMNPVSKNMTPPRTAMATGMANLAWYGFGVGVRVPGARVPPVNE